MFEWDGAVGEVTLSLSLSFSLGGSWLNFEVCWGVGSHFTNFVIYINIGGEASLYDFFYFFLFFILSKRGTYRTVSYLSNWGHSSNCVSHFSNWGHFSNYVLLVKFGALFELCVPLLELGTLFELCDLTFRTMGSFSNCGVTFSKKKGGASPFRTGPTSRTGRGEGNPN